MDINSRRRGSIGLGPLFSLALSSLSHACQRDIQAQVLNMQLLHEIVKNRAILQLYQHEDSDCGRLAPAECHLQAVCGARVAYATRLRLRQAFERMHMLFRWVQNIGIPRYPHHEHVQRQTSA